MKKISLLFLFVFCSCAHHYESSDHHHHRGKGNYTKSPKDLKAYYDQGLEGKVKPEDRHVAEKEEYQLYYDGRFYYFTSEEKLKNFKKRVCHK